MVAGSYNSFNEDYIQNIHQQAVNYTVGSKVMIIYQMESLGPLALNLW